MIFLEHLFLQIYFPKEGRKINIPPLFTDTEALAEVLKKGGDRYLYVLDRNCVQVCQISILLKLLQFTYVVCSIVILSVYLCLSIVTLICVTDTHIFDSSKLSIE